MTELIARDEASEQQKSEFGEGEFSEGRLTNSIHQSIFPSSLNLSANSHQKLTTQHPFNRQHQARTLIKKAIENTLPDLSSL